MNPEVEMLLEETAGFVRKAAEADEAHTLFREIAVEHIARLEQENATLKAQSQMVQKKAADLETTGGAVPGGQVHDRAVDAILGIAGHCSSITRDDARGLTVDGLVKVLEKTASELDAIKSGSSLGAPAGSGAGAGDPTQGEQKFLDSVAQLRAKLNRAI